MKEVDEQNLENHLRRKYPKIEKLTRWQRQYTHVGKFLLPPQTQFRNSQCKDLVNKPLCQFKIF